MDKASPKEEAKHPQPGDFDDYLPWACNQLQVPAAVMVIKNKQNEYVGSGITERSKSKGKSKLKVTGSRVELSDQNKEDKSCSALGGWATSFKNVLIYTLYDQCDNLVHIKFDNNLQIPQAIIKIIGMIVKFHIFLSGVTINRGLSISVLHELCKLLPLSHITDVCLDNAFISEANYHILLEKPTNLKHLSLAKCKIDDSVIKNIAPLLTYPQPASKTLSILNLSSNRISDVGAKILGEVLRTNRKLCYLNLANNAIGDDGAERILSDLMEFPMTCEEILSGRARHMTYLKQKNELIARIMKELRNVDFERRIIKKKTMRPTTTVPVKKSKGMEKEPSLKSMVDPNGKSLVNIEAALYEKAATMAENGLGAFVDPFSADNTISRDGIMYCCGNNSLCYLNLAYNNVTYFTVKKLLDVLLYQKYLDRKPRGLFNVNIEGNYVPMTCKELDRVDDILDTGLMTHKRLSGVKKKAAPRSGK